MLVNAKMQVQAEFSPGGVHVEELPAASPDEDEHDGDEDNGDEDNGDDPDHHVGEDRRFLLRRVVVFLLRVLFFLPRLCQALVVRHFGFVLELPLNWWNCGLVVLVIGLVFPTMTYPLAAICRLVLGTLYPAYESYKAVRTKNVREYVRRPPLSYLSD